MTTNNSTTQKSYDRIGIGYDTTRRADTYLAQRMFHFLDASNKGLQCLDVGCGTGNYTAVLHEMGLDFIGIDPSEEMLSKARKKAPSIHWERGSAEGIDLPTSFIDRILISLSIHHWSSLTEGFVEVSRVLKPQGKVVLFTPLPNQTKAYWLHHYFPKMIEDSAKVLPALDQIESAFEHAGLEIIEREPYFVQPDLQDWFLYSGKHHPEMYFREEVRKGISSFALLANQPEVEKGLRQMRKDIDSGKIEEVMRAHENDLGDYLFLVGQKR